MMLLSLIPLAVSLVLAPAAPVLSRCLAPRLAAPLLTLLALATSLATGIVLCLAAFIAVARLPLAARLGQWSTEPLQAGQPGPGWGVLAGAVASILLAAAVVFAARAIRDLARAARACRELDPDAGARAGGGVPAGAGAGPGVRDRVRAMISAVTGAGRVIITEDERPLAYAVPLPAGAIVVSTGMLRLLSAAERRAILAHESAHLRQCHALYVLLADLAARANPLLRPLAAQVRLATELAADERAADEVGDRRVVARALARASLAARGGRPGGIPAGTVPAGSPGGLAIADTHAGTRVRVLLSPPRRRRPWAAATALALTLASAGAAVTLTLTTHQQIESAQLAYEHAHPAALAEAGPHHELTVRR
ncbi:MAG TPA: M56 family metallopeptidase [Streptosporangiaceae bacterium]|nr:M56 family metallopeptidase [Streptosporangiaceae bacterium]